MLAATVVLASLWAQAEQAPPPPAPAPPPAPEPPPPANRLRVHGAFAYRLEDGGGIVTQAGFSVGAAFERRYLTLTGGADLGVAIDGSFTRFSSATAGSPVSPPGGEGMAYTGGRTLLQSGFALLQTAGWQLGRVRPFVAAGGGVSIGYFSTPEFDLRPGTASTTQPLARAMAGVDIAVSPTTALTVRANYSHMFTNPTFTTDVAGSFSLFGSLLDVGVGMVARF
jgi:hypothetical protein